MKITDESSKLITAYGDATMRFSVTRERTMYANAQRHAMSETRHELEARIIKLEKFELAVKTARRLARANNTNDKKLN